MDHGDRARELAHRHGHGHEGSGQHEEEHDSRTLRRQPGGVPALPLPEGGGDVGGAVVAESLALVVVVGEAVGIGTPYGCAMAG
jgi:hypothetical protein